MADVLCMPGAAAGLLPATGREKAPAPLSESGTRGEAAGTAASGGSAPAEDVAAADLARRIGAGDASAEAALVQRYSRGTLFLLRRVTGDPDLADDLHQETFRVVLERLRDRGINRPERLAGFIRSTARNLAIGEYRKRARRATDSDSEAVERSIEAGEGQLGTVLRRERAGAVRQALGELKTDRDRQLIYRFYIAEEDKEAICADLELTSLHFNRVLFRARQRFRQILEEADLPRAVHP